MWRLNQWRLVGTHADQHSIPLDWLNPHKTTITIIGFTLTVFHTLVTFDLISAVHFTVQSDTDLHAYFRFYLEEYRSWSEEHHLYEPECAEFSMNLMISNLTGQPSIMLSSQGLFRHCSYYLTSKIYLYTVNCQDES